MTDITSSWLIGITVGIVIVIVLIKAFNKDGSIKTKYDERQQIVRGKAYMYGFYTAIITSALLMVLETGTFGIQKLGFIAFFLPIITGVIAQVSYCIFKDGYIGLNTNITRFIVIMTVIGVFNLVFGIGMIASGELIQYGKVQPSFINLLCGLMFAIIAVELIIKKCLDGREG